MGCFDGFNLDILTFRKLQNDPARFQMSARDPLSHVVSKLSYIYYHLFLSYAVLDVLGKYSIHYSYICTKICILCNEDDSTITYVLAIPRFQGISSCLKRNSCDAIKRSTCTHNVHFTPTYRIASLVR